jgi:chromosomal replication initiator protein
MTLETIWDSALGEIELSLSKAQFETWFKGTKILSLEGEKVFIQVSNGFAKEWLENKYNLIILQALNNNGHKIREVLCKVGENSQKISSLSGGIDAITGPKHNANTTQNHHHQTQSQKSPPQSHQFTPRASSISQNTPHHQTANINPRYTFESFIVGGNNELARAACLAVCEDLGSIYNPLFLYGGVGLGKTHLLQSIGNAILHNQPEKKVLYTTSEKFTQELITSIKEGSVDAFKDSYRKIDLLIIDDVQFLSGKEKTQNEFFHIFNALYQDNKQIVISSDRPPKAIATLEDRLRSRFEGGMIADVNRPDFETRIAILHTKALQKNLSLNDDVLSYIAQNITQNIRELEGALNRIIAVQQFSQKSSLTLKEAQSILKELISGGKKKSISHQDILEAVSKFYEISLEELKQKGRKKEISNARQIAMYLMREELTMPYTAIGRCFGGRDHTTALHACEKIEKLIEHNEKTKKDISYLKEKIYFPS